MPILTLPGSEYIYLRNHPVHAHMGELFFQRSRRAYPEIALRLPGPLRNMLSTLESFRTASRRNVLLEGAGALFAVGPGKRPGQRIAMINSEPSAWQLNHGSVLQKRILRRSLSKVDVFFSVTDYMRGLISSVLPDSRHVDFRLYLDPTRWMAIPDSNESLDWFTIGRCDAFKNQALLVDAYREAAKLSPTPFSLKIVGNIHPSYATEMASRLGNGVSVTGWTAAPWKELDGCGVYFNLSRHEPAGIAILEAMAAGRIPIVSRWCGFRDVVASVDPRLVVDLEIRSILEAWLWLTDLPRGLRKRMSDRCRQLAGSYTMDAAESVFRTSMEEAFGLLEERPSD